MDRKQLLSRFVATPSLSGEEAPLAQVICAVLDDLGVEYFLRDGNVICCLDNGADKALIFNAHMDTVAPGDSWSSDPYTLTERKGRYYGLGVSDEQISLVLMLELVEELLGGVYETDFWFCFVINEEVDGLGSRLFAEYFAESTSYQEAACVLMEPTNNSFMELGKKGNYFGKLTARGAATHSSRPDTGVNAVSLLLDAFTRLEEFVSSLQEVDERLGSTTLACPTTISGGTSVNVVPDQASATFDIRTIPQTHQQVLDALPQLLQGLPVELSAFATPAAPSLTSRDERIVSLFVEQGVTDIRYSSGSDDSTFFTAIGVPCVVFGAGNKECIHQADEYIDIANIEPAFRRYVSVAKSF